MPVALAPVGMTGMQHADGERKAARAAERFGVPFTLSTMSINSIEEVAEVTPHTVVVCGTRDLANRRGCAELRDGIPGARLKLLHGVGHDVPSRAPERLAQIVGDVIAGLDPRTSA